MAKLIINKEKCGGCGTCVAVCPEGAAFDDDGKAKVIDSQKLENCGGVSICPSQAIEESTKIQAPRPNDRIRSVGRANNK